MRDGGKETETGSNPALDQVRARGYSEKYLGESGREVLEVGLVFSSEARNLVQADWVALRRA